MSQSQSDTDSSDNSETEKLRAALDPSFSLDAAREKKSETVSEAKSNGRDPGRIIGSCEREWDSGHSSQTFQITPEMKKFIARRLEEALDKHIKIKEVNKKKNPKDSVNGSTQSEIGIFLFSNSSCSVSQSDLIAEDFRKSSTKRKKLEFKRRKIDQSDSEDEREKLKSAAVSCDWVINKSI